MAREELNRDVVIVIATVFLYFTGLGGMGSIISRFGRVLGASTLETGLMFSLGPLIGVLSRIPSGIYADKLGSKYFMSLGGFILFTASLYASIASNYSELFIVRSIQGLSMGLFISASIAAVSIYGYMKYLYRLLAYRAAAISLSSLIGPPLSSFLVDTAGYQTAFTVVSLFGLFTAILSLLLPRKVDVGARGMSGLGIVIKAIRNRVVTALFILPLANGGVFISLYSLQQDHIYSIGYGATIFGYYIFIVGLIGIFSRLYAIKIIEIIGSLKTVILGLVFEIVGLFLLYFWNGDQYHLYIVGLLYGGGIGLTVPSGQYILLSNVEEEIRNTATAVYANGFDIGGSIGVIAFSYIAQLFGFNFSYLLMAIYLIVTSSALYYLLSRVSHNG